MIILNRKHLAASFKRMRLTRRMTQHQLAQRLYVHQHTISVRETHARLDLDAIIDTAHVFGYDVALIPQRHPGARPTGTGWPT